MNVSIVSKVLFVIGIFLELCMMSLLKGKPNIYISPLLWTLGALLTVLGAMPQLVFNKEVGQISSTPRTSKGIFTVLGLFSISAVILAFFINQVFIAHPSNPLESDVIPTIEILVRRLLHAEWIYAPIDFPGWTVRNAYLPMQYLPFVLAEWSHMDYRWLAYIVFLLAILLWIRKAWYNQDSVIELALKVLFVFVALLILNKHDMGSLAYSLELIDVAFYLFLALSFFHTDWKVKALAILVCLLSRYAFVFWLPFYAISFWIEFGKVKALRVIGLVIAGVLVLYVIPFLTKQPNLFFEGIKYYDQTAIGQWLEIPNWYQSVGKPYHLTQGLSTSIYFYDFWNGSITAKLNAAKLVHLIANLCSVILISWLYVKWRKRPRFNYNGFLLLSLKFYFIFFYGLFYVPFSYLYWISFFFSMAILFNLSFVKRNAAES